MEESWQGPHSALMEMSFDESKSKAGHDETSQVRNAKKSSRKKSPASFSATGSTESKSKVCKKEKKPRAIKKASKKTGRFLGAEDFKQYSQKKIAEIEVKMNAIGDTKNKQY